MCLMVIKKKGAKAAVWFIDSLLALIASKKYDALAVVNIDPTLKLIERYNSDLSDLSELKLRLLLDYLLDRYTELVLHLRETPLGDSSKRQFPLTHHNLPGLWFHCGLMSFGAVAKWTEGDESLLHDINVHGDRQLFVKVDEEELKVKIFGDVFTEIEPGIFFYSTRKEDK